MKTAQNRSVDLPVVVILCLSITVIPLAFLTSAFDVFGTVKYASLLLLAAAALGIMAWQTAANGNLRIPTGWPARLLGTFLLWLTISTLFSPVPMISFFGLRKSLLGLITYLALAVLLIAAARVNWDRRNLRALFLTVSFTATATSLLGIAQYLGATFPLDLKMLFSSAAYSTFGNPTFLGSFLALTLPISLYLSMGGQSAEDKLVGYLSSPIILAGLFATSSSGAALGAIIGAGVYFAGRFLRNNTGSLKYIVIAVIMALTVSLITVWAVTGENTAIQQRLWAWSASFQVAVEYPVVGTGLENLQAGIGKLDIPPEDESYAGTYQDAHNNWLNMATTAGWPAAILWLGFLISAFSGGVKSSFYKHEEYAILLAVSAGVVGYLVTIQFSPQDIGSLPLVWIFLGLTLSLTGRVKSVEIGILPARIASILLIPVLGAVCLIAVNSVMAEMSLLNANNPPDMQTSIASFEEAQRRQPWQSQYYVIEVFRLLPSLTALDSPLGNELKETARRGIRVNPGDPEARLALGHIYRANAKIKSDDRLYRRALSAYKQALTVDRYNQAAYKFIALTYHDLNEDSRSLEWINKHNRFFSPDPELAALKR